MLTLEKLKEMKPNTIFATGYNLIEHPWFNDAKRCLEKDGRSVKVKWVAIRGFYHDWAIYHSLDANFIQEDYLDSKEHLKIGEERIARAGAKLHNEDKIKEFVLCDDEAFKMYRH